MKHPHSGDYAGEPETIKCVRCPKPATTHYGHVADAAGRTILAGWCKTHFAAERRRVVSGTKDDCPIVGCCGPWAISMGVRFSDPEPEQ